MTGSMFLCWIGLASAGDTVALSVGANAVVNDPFQTITSFSAGVEYQPRPTLSFGFEADYTPNLGQANWKLLTQTLVEDLRVTPDISRPTARVALTTRVWPIAARGPWVQTRVGFHGGIGAVRTVDDLEALGDDSPTATATQVQWHSMGVAGIVGEAKLGDWVAIRVHLDRFSYIETVNSSTLEMKSTTAFGSEVTLWL